MQSEMFALWADGKDPWKGKYKHFPDFTLVRSTENIFCKSGTNNHFHYIFGMCFCHSKAPTNSNTNKEGQGHKYRSCMSENILSKVLLM